MGSSKKPKTIVVNDVAASSGGALSVLKQFLDEISSNNLARKFKWIIFVSNNEVNEYNSDYIDIIKVNMKSWPKRIWWDIFGIKKWLKLHNIEPIAAISLMSVGLKYLNIPQIVYLHQSLPFGNFQEFKWFEWKARFYTWGIFKWMKWSINKDSIIVVQTNWMKEAVHKKLNIPRKNIYIIRPKVEIPKIDTELLEIEGSKSSFSHRLFYPAVPGASYKNHELLIRTLAMIKQKDYNLFGKLKLVFTCKPSDSKLTKHYYRLAYKLEVSEQIEWVGYLTKEQMLKEYIDADLVLFPSKLETFGLPLIEAASLGKPILVLDKPYAHDVLKNYNGAKYLKDDPEKWSQVIQDINSIGKSYCEPFFGHELNEWMKFIDLINKTVKN